MVLFSTFHFLPSTFQIYPCRCLCLGFSQMTRITPFRFTILHLSQIFLTDALTFIFFIQLFRKLDLAFQIPPHPPLLKGGEGGLIISPEI